MRRLRIPQAGIDTSLASGYVYSLWDIYPLDPSVNLYFSVFFIILKVMGKVCSKCKVEKDFNEFSKAKAGKFGLRGKCKVCQSEYDKEYLNSDKGNEVRRKWWQTDKGKEVKKIFNKRQREKYPQIVHWHNLLHSTLIRLKTSKSKSTIKEIGYSADELKTHLDNLNMNWEVDHIDHKIPVSYFKNNTPSHIVNHLQNLQPLKPEVNISKGNSYADRVDEEYYRMARPYLL